MGFEIGVNCRELNKLTIKSNIIYYGQMLCSTIFMIQKYFLRLKSGYHLICVKELDIKNIAFQLWSSHYEHVVMHFSLTNASSMFMNLVNVVFP